MAPRLDDDLVKPVRVAASLLTSASMRARSRTRRSTIAGVAVPESMQGNNCTTPSLLRPAANSSLISITRSTASWS
jgi:hypothetical protein